MNVLSGRPLRQRDARELHPSSASRARGTPVAESPIPGVNGAQTFGILLSVVWCCLVSRIALAIH
jgi:hypothetical protein